MNVHLTEGELRASLDLELDRAQSHHLETCAECQIRQSEIRQEHNRLQNRLAFLTQEQEAVPPAEAAWRRFPLRSTKQKETSMFRKWFAFPVVRIGAVAILVLALLLVFPSTRALASEVLKLFRVEQVAVLPIDTSNLEKLTGNETLGKQFSKLMSDSTEVTKEPAEPVSVADAAEASQAAGFKVRLPGGLTPASILVADSSAFVMKIDRAKAQALVDEVGRSDLILPETIDGAKISVKIPASVNATFGICPSLEAEETDLAERQKYRDCLIFGQSPSPSVNAPASVDIAELAQIGLELTGMSHEEAAALASTIDWTSTLVVPLPRNAGTYAEVSVDGVEGFLIQSDSKYDSQFALVWVKDGILYFISGSGADASRAFDLVKVLP
jgi:hypothetical protein